MQRLHLQVGGSAATSLGAAQSGLYELRGGQIRHRELKGGLVHFPPRHPPPLPSAASSSNVGVVMADPFKGNPVVCLLEGKYAVMADERLSPLGSTSPRLPSSSVTPSPPPSLLGSSAFVGSPPIAEVDLCGHATLASTHFLFTTILAKQQDVAMVKFVTRSDAGILTVNGCSIDFNCCL